MLRKAFVMQVHARCHDEYLRRHTSIWPELAQTLKDHGVHHYAIWLDAERHLLFASVDIESEARWQAIAQTEVCQRWWASMKTLMPVNADNSPVSSELQPMFYLR